MRKSREPPTSRFPALTDHLALCLDACPRCGGAGCKECHHSRSVLECFGYEPDDVIDLWDEDEDDDLDPDEDEDDDMDPRFDPEDDEMETIRRRKEKADESFARRLAMGVSMLAGADDSILDD